MLSTSPPYVCCDCKMTYWFRRADGDKRRPRWAPETPWENTWQRRRRTSRVQRRGHASAPTDRRLRLSADDTPMHFLSNWTNEKCLSLRGAYEILNFDSDPAIGFCLNCAIGRVHTNNSLTRRRKIRTAAIILEIGGSSSTCTTHMHNASALVSSRSHLKLILQLICICKYHWLRPKWDWTGWLIQNRSVSRQSAVSIIQGAWNLSGLSQPALSARLRISLVP